MGVGFVPNVFQARTGYLPLSQLDADLAYVSGKVVTVLDFGAVADGVTDDSAAITAALNYGGTIIFPSGTYYCASPITISGKDGLCLIGSGSSNTYLVFAAGINGVSITYGDVRYPPRVQGLTIATLTTGPAVAGTGITIIGAIGSSHDLQDRCTAD
jgi:hypothetical protein